MTRSRGLENPDARFAALYAEHYEQVLGYVLRRAPAELAPDVVADVFLVAWRRLDRVPDQPLPWLLGVARKTLANQRRGRRRRAALLDALKQNRTEREAQVPVDGQLRVVAEAVDRLGETDRELLKVIAWDGLTTREAAIVLGISHAACRVRLHRLRRRLAGEIGAAAGDLKATIPRVGRLEAGKDT
jgi:RNA polymerase sigma-70 factor, ECF subfamily